MDFLQRLDSSHIFFWQQLLSQEHNYERELDKLLKHSRVVSGRRRNDGTRKLRDVGSTRVLSTTRYLRLTRSLSHCSRFFHGRRSLPSLHVLLSQS